MGRDIPGPVTCRLGRPRAVFEKNLGGDKAGDELPRWLGAKRICLLMQETQETQFQSLGGEDPLEEEMATHSSILAWKIPWIEDHGKL